jgi:hypothetical protein
LDLSALYEKPKDELSVFFKMAKSKEKLTNTQGKPYYKYDWDNAIIARFKKEDIVRILRFAKSKGETGKDKKLNLFHNSDKNIQKIINFAFDDKNNLTLWMTEKEGEKKKNMSIQLSHDDIYLFNISLDQYLNQYISFGIKMK